MNKAGNVARTVAVVGGLALLWTLRYGVYVVLTAVGPLVRWGTMAIAGVGMFMFLALLAMHQQPDVMWGSAIAVVAVSAFRLVFDALLQALAPPGTVIIS